MGCSGVPLANGTPAHHRDDKRSECLIVSNDGKGTLGMFDLAWI